MKFFINSSAKSDVGRKRSINEDAYLEQKNDSLFIVADGMGGHAAGEIASKMAVEIVKDFMQTSKHKDISTWPFDWDSKLPIEANRLNNAVKLANREIFAKANSDFSVAGMGTTIVTLFIHEGIAYIAHVGDSRAYLVRNSSIYRLTTDHSWVEDQVKAGNISEEDARQHPMRNVITRALGTQDSVNVDIRMERWNINDYFVLCTDGLTTHLEDSEIINGLHKHNGMVKDISKYLVNEANLKGGDDNITVIVVHVQKEVK
ncbi:MAG: hypothetical protein A2161_22355 [Candidatus Schekmanbacteria bacterium RBG_13_48_7]|uniref:PPM-type phosphatase domain-containing protein n=1 Tax=Candidatus Schekmanbacteria bacterium RBG_13_48_7 TaxID=1817878 RepID=A0A1F7RYE7_9BACT|nr:MAG: hypothetical protein A2161_22355 [Candidatus Schekmanbacteria bacterium RBG_13_48_7]